VLVAALVDSGPDGTWAESILEHGSINAPELILVETANVLRRLERAEQISSLEATSAYRDAMRLDLELFPYQPFAERIWALRENLTSYDAWYVGLAEALACPLATLDARLSRASGPRCEVVTASAAR
jgi:predicted nucleic acid-binding protein